MHTQCENAQRASQQPEHIGLAQFSEATNRDKRSVYGRPHKCYHTYCNSTIYPPQTDPQTSKDGGASTSTNSGAFTSTNSASMGLRRWTQTTAECQQNTNGVSPGTNSSASTSRGRADYTGGVMHTVIIDGIDCSSYAPSSSSQMPSLTCRFIAKTSVSTSMGSCTRAASGAPGACEPSSTPGSRHPCLGAVVHACEPEPELGEHSVELVRYGLHQRGRTGLTESISRRRMRPTPHPSCCESRMISATPSRARGCCTPSPSCTLLPQATGMLSCGPLQVPECAIQVVKEHKRGTKHTEDVEAELVALLTRDIVGI
ncbi:uncharacterized protein B0H18DRAFT_959769 [Fomitopsis serialis]|uniref:uncharacterized protein n=1 Tax=Fomitopsis serialis TaxID=139415 RepID=UPI002007586F|nr:uncharacterized protein B0H18DRAFT_959769 [Neoantrodia serialis]KAH9914555.1 hypothetical protein B0H18DRAFT_959769 [Neoantrodia serialis]